jgi:hypothetical protein
MLDSAAVEVDHDACPLRGVAVDRSAWVAIVDLLTTLRVLLARWYVMVPALLLTVAATLAVTAAVAPAYRATGAVVLLVPNALTDGAGAGGQAAGGVRVNPYLEFGSSLEVTADVLTKVMTSDAAVARTRAAGGTAEYELGTGDNGGSPIIDIQATGRSASESIRTVRVVTARISDELARRQRLAGAPTRTWIRAVVLTAPASARRLLGSKLRAGAAVLALGVAATFSLVFLTEAVAESRRRGAGGGGAGGTRHARPAAAAGQRIAPPERVLGSPASRHARRRQAAGGR